MRWKTVFAAAALLAALAVTPARVSASSISLASPQAARLTHSAALPFPTKSYDFAGTLIDAPDDYLFGRPTSHDTIYQEEKVNVDRGKNTALIPPAFGSSTSYLPGSGEALTPNLVPGALTGGGLVSSAGSVTCPTVDGGVSWTHTAYTSVTDDLYYKAGHLGTLKIPALDLSVKVYQGTDSKTLAKGAGHFTDTSLWDGNVCIAAHNRGANNHFGKLHTLEVGDTVTWTTKLGTRTYEVVSVSKVSEIDASGTAATADNCLTLYTCVRDQRDYRWMVRAVEK